MKLDSRYIDIENGIIAQKDDYIILVKTWAEILMNVKLNFNFSKKASNIKRRL